MLVANAQKLMAMALVLSSAFLLSVMAGWWDPEPPRQEFHVRVAEQPVIAR